MSISLLNILVPALSGFLGVLIGSLKPLIDWNIEKRKMRHSERKQLLNDFRTLLTSQNINQQGIVHSMAYSRLRTSLPNEITKKFENLYEPRFPNHLRDWMTYELIDALHKLEKKWGLL